MPSNIKTITVADSEIAQKENFLSPFLFSSPPLSTPHISHTLCSYAVFSNFLSFPSSTLPPFSFLP